MAGSYSSAIGGVLNASQLYAQDQDLKAFSEETKCYLWYLNDKGPVDSSVCPGNWRDTNLLKVTPTWRI